MAATTVHDDNLAVGSEDFYLLKAICLTLNKEELRKSFPQRIEEIEPCKESGWQCFVFTQIYASHLARIMKRSTKTLNDFLRAAGNQLSFSYGTSKYYNGHTVEDVLLQDWPVPTIAWNIESCLLKWIATVSEAIKCFKCYMVKLPVQVKADSLHGMDCTITSPTMEDTLWASEVVELVRTTLELNAKMQRCAPETPVPQAKDTAAYSRDRKGLCQATCPRTASSTYQQTKLSITVHQPFQYREPIPQCSRALKMPQQHL